MRVGKVFKIAFYINEAWFKRAFLKASQKRRTCFRKYYKHQKDLKPLSSIES
ncbi:MAG: hypothetical protein ACI9OE_001311 [Mariniflexile sp.]|jgi:hypothetical protein